ncbi:MAG TPA: preprotein translocase subunit SecG [Burkholderiales bacterium]|jgi:preprotein translocase subunit SecG|nr:preprotein translocase subunit SecG [Burkholderiales bacterium]
MIGWTNVLIVLHVLVALAIIGLVLLQHGKGADMGSGFGGGASGSLFGATGSANFLSRTTAVLATLFFLLSLALAYVATHRVGDEGSVVDRVPAKAKPAAEAQKPAAEPQKPAAPAEAPSGKEVPR